MANHREWPCCHVFLFTLRNFRSKPASLLWTPFPLTEIFSASELNKSVSRRAANCTMFLQGYCSYFLLFTCCLNTPPSSSSACRSQACLSKEAELHLPSSFTDCSPDNCISNKQTVFLLLQHFFLWGLCHSTQRWRYELPTEVSRQTGFWFQPDGRQGKIASSQHIWFCCKIISLPAASSSDLRKGSL